MVFVGCATAPSNLPKKYQDRARTTGKLKTATPEDHAAFAAVRTLYQKGAHEAAILKINAFIKKRPDSSMVGQMYNLGGLIYLSRKEYATAQTAFERALRFSPEPVFDHYVQYNLATVHFEAKKFKEARTLLLAVQPTVLSPPNQLKYYFLRGAVQRKLEQYPEATRSILEAARLGSDRKVFEPELEAALSQIKDVAALDSVVRDFPDSLLGDLLLFRLATLTRMAGDKAGADPLFRQLLAKYPQSPKYNEAITELRALQNESIVDSQSIGVLLPMTGKFAKFGLQSLWGIELAFRIFNADEPESRVTLHIEDSGETPEQAIAALERLYYEHHVIAAIGPMTSKGIDLVVKKAEELSLPLLYLSQSPGPPSSFAFPMAVTADTQVTSLLNWAVDQKRYKRFAVLYPDDKLGREFANLFWDRVEQRGGEIVGFEGYSPGETDFRLPVQRISGLAYPEARGRELTALEKYREEHDIKKKTRRNEQYFKLEPIVDFDAVFIPDEGRVISQILPTFAYHEIENVQFLGNSTWNTQSLLARSRTYVEDAVFVDGYNAQSKSRETQDFRARFEKTFGETPNGVHALAFDAASLIEAALFRSGGSPSRSDLRDLLHQIQNFSGVTGRLSFSDNGIIRELKQLTVEKGQVTEILRVVPPS